MRDFLSEFEIFLNNIAYNDFESYLLPFSILETKKIFYTQIRNFSFPFTILKIFSTYRNSAIIVIQQFTLLCACLLYPWKINVYYCCKVTNLFLEPRNKVQSGFIFETYLSIIPRWINIALPLNGRWQIITRMVYSEFGKKNILICIEI